MNVLITTSTFPLSDDDGTPRFVYDLAKAMSRSCRVTVLAPHASGAPSRERIGALTVRRFRYSWPERTQCLAYHYGMRQNLRVFFGARALVPFFMASLAWAVRTSIRKERFDILNSHWLVPQGLAGALVIGAKSPLAHVITSHAGDVAFLERMALGRRFAHWIADRSNLFLPVSTPARDGLQRLVDGTVPMIVQPMGVSYTRFATRPDAEAPEMPFSGNFILFVGRLVEKKGLAHLLEAMPLISTRSEAPGLVVIGSGALRRQLERKAARLGMRDRVLFMGSMGHRKLIHYLHGCSAVALPSIVDRSGETEGMPAVLAEALCAGCKVVASRVGGIPDVLDNGRNGWLAAPGDPVDLAAQLSAALEDSQGVIQRCARQTARNLDWSHIAENYLTYFENALALHGKRAMKQR